MQIPWLAPQETATGPLHEHKQYVLGKDLRGIISALCLTHTEEYYY